MQKLQYILHFQYLLLLDQSCFDMFGNVYWKFNHWFWHCFTGERQWQIDLDYNFVVIHYRIFLPNIVRWSYFCWKNKHSWTDYYYNRYSDSGKGMPGSDYLCSMFRPCDTQSHLSGTTGNHSCGFVLKKNQIIQQCISSTALVLFR